MTYTAPLRGRPLVDAVLDVIQNHPDLHKQEVVIGIRCNTTACIAGWAVSLALGSRPGDALGDYDGCGLYRVGPNRTTVVGFDEEALQLIFDKTSFDEYEWDRLVCRFNDEVFENFDRDSAIANFREIADDHADRLNR
jgi:hypothetical protein